MSSFGPSSVRSHYLPVFSRQGPYDRAELDRAQHGRRRALLEYWAHEASLVPVATWPLLRWRMAAAERGEGIYGGLLRFSREKPEMIASVLAQVERRGALAAGDLEGGGKGRGSWWGWSDGKRALEWLFWTGRLTTAARRNFERLYDIPERVLPRGIADAPAPSPPAAQRALLLIAARAMGVAAERDLRDYWRLPLVDARARLAELVEDGALRPMAVRGWREPAYLDPEARRPRRVDASALLSPFDSLVWFRPRAERLFDFRYRLELYTPAHKRVHGYYVLPFLHRERLQARVDLKADRQAGVLRVHAVHPEPRPDDDWREALIAQLESVAGWLGLDDIRNPLIPAKAGTQVF